MKHWTYPLYIFGKLQWYLNFILFMILLVLIGCNTEQSSSEAMKEQEDQKLTQSKTINTLSSEEQEEGWVLLFNGETTEDWRGIHKETFPEKGWVVEDGQLKVIASDGEEAGYGGDIVTKKQYDSFEFSLEFKLTEGANSGIKYFVKEKYGTGLEYQIIDDSRPDVEGTWTLASLYELFPARNKKVNPIGEFNRARILVQGNHVEHWLNGKKVVEYTRGSEKYRALVSKSKYKDYENFGEASEGHILLQDHGHEVAFRNIKIREISLIENE